MSDIVSREEIGGALKGHGADYVEIRVDDTTTSRITYRGRELEEIGAQVEELLVDGLLLVLAGGRHKGDQEGGLHACTLGPANPIGCPRLSNGRPASGQAPGSGP